MKLYVKMKNVSFTLQKKLNGFFWPTQCLNDPYYWLFVLFATYIFLVLFLNVLNVYGAFCDVEFKRIVVVHNQSFLFGFPLYL